MRAISAAMLTRVTSDAEALIQPNPDGEMTEAREVRGLNAEGRAVGLKYAWCTHVNTSRSLRKKK